MIDLRKQLQVGQTISVDTLESGLKSVTILPAGQAGCRITEVGCDFVVAEDEAAEMRHRLPVHCVKIVTEPVEPDGPAQAA